MLAFLLDQVVGGESGGAPITFSCRSATLEFLDIGSRRLAFSALVRLNAPKDWTVSYRSIRSSGAGVISRRMLPAWEIEPRGSGPSSERLGAW